MHLTNLLTYLLNGQTVFAFGINIARKKYMLAPFWRHVGINLDFSSVDTVDVIVIVAVALRQLP